MRTLLRKVLKAILKYLSQLAIKKHKIQIVAISGWYGTEVVKEAIYQSLKEDYVVRRNVEGVTWDFSIPLTILGYKDLRYSFKGWFQVISATLWVLLFEKSNPQIQILELDADKKEIYEYWLSILSPEILIIVNSNEDVEEAEDILLSGMKKNGLLLCPEEVYREIKEEYIDRIKPITFGEEGKVNLVNDTILIEGREFEFKTIHPSFIKELLVLSVPVAEYLQLDLEVVINKLKTFEFSAGKVSSVMERIKGNGEK